MSQTQQIVKPETVTIDKITYKVENAFTPEDHENEGRHNIAREMRRCNMALELWMTKPKGKKHFIAEQYVSGRYSTVRSFWL